MVPVNQPCYVHSQPSNHLWKETFSYRKLQNQTISYPSACFSQKQLAKSISVVLTAQMDDIHLKVEEIIGLGRSPYSNFWGSLSQEDQKIVNEAIHEVGIQHLRGRIFNTLSDGERQKVMIAKALAQQTPLSCWTNQPPFLIFQARWKPYSCSSDWPINSRSLSSFLLMM